MSKDVKAAMAEVFGKGGEIFPGPKDRELATGKPAGKQPKYFRLWIPRPVYARIKFLCTSRGLRPGQVLADLLDKCGVASAET